MSLVKCLECGQEISDQAEICVKCGRPLDAREESNSNRSMLWNAATKTRTPITVFAFAMMACASVPGASATQFRVDTRILPSHTLSILSSQFRECFTWLFYFAGKEYITPKISTKSGLKYSEILARIDRLSLQF